MFWQTNNKIIFVILRKCLLQHSRSVVNKVKFLIFCAVDELTFCRNCRLDIDHLNISQATCFLGSTGVMNVELHFMLEHVLITIDFGVFKCCRRFGNVAKN